MKEGNYNPHLEPAGCEARGCSFEADKRAPCEEFCGASYCKVCGHQDDCHSIETLLRGVEGGGRRTKKENHCCLEEKEAMARHALRCAIMLREGDVVLELRSLYADPGSDALGQVGEFVLTRNGHYSEDARELHFVTDRDKVGGGWKHSRIYWNDERLKVRI
jgi:hypothetical protein